jgi:hypothetical protein
MGRQLVVLQARLEWQRLLVRLVWLEQRPVQQPAQVLALTPLRQ